MQNMLLAFLVAFLTTVVATPLSLIFIKKAGLIDDPKKHHHPAMIHTKPVPRGGGIPLFIGIFIASIFFLPFTKITIALFIAGFITLIVGVLDDKYDIHPLFRLATNILVACIVVGSGVGIPYITNPLGGVLHLDSIKITFDFVGKHTILPFSDLLAILWIIWVMNMLNWSKGVDGQMPGVVGISALVIGILSLRFSLLDPHTFTAAMLSFLIAGASLGFLLFNFYPAKLFPGYGATAVYLFLSVVSILSGAKLATAILVMGVPMVDGIFTIVRRILAGKSPFWGDNKHLHHMLLRMGYGQRRIALSYWLVSALLGGIALTLSSKGKLFAILMLGAIVGGGLLFLHLTLNKDHEKHRI